ncbi:MAG: hypothetical protein JETT_1591 [Candidatus Jettenia ecosi]|uniref:Transcobalamin-like C-terminal domain-containing protein n=1 Tax=Candidatus Jettenia ecosi TaxID=2494326 RepID=A0A533QHG8_9BACT|nr:MAG: hypothetical protein JETT_1591 [Candidatus Jettenia ecosi]
MKHFGRVAGSFIFFIFLSTAFCAHRNVMIEIDYGGLHQNLEVEIPWKQGITVLEALQSVAKVETQQKGEYFLVTSIDKVKGQAGNKVWYYHINGKHATSFANTCVLNEGDRMRWEYTKDVCSRMVNKEVCE